MLSTSSTEKCFFIISSVFVLLFARKYYAAPAQPFLVAGTKIRLNTGTTQGGSVVHL